MDDRELIDRYFYGDPSLGNDELRAVADANREAMLAENPWADMGALLQAAQAIANENASKRSKVAKFIKLIDRLGGALAPHVACRRGCNHCCHIQTTIAKTDAERIEAFTGRKKVELPVRHPEEVKAVTSVFFGVPCPFLANGECSIYEARPFTCRSHHSLNATPDQCDLKVPSSESCVECFSGVRAVELPMAFVLREEALGDIREFFPTNASSSNP